MLATWLLFTLRAWLALPSARCFVCVACRHSRSPGELGRAATLFRSTAAAERRSEVGGASNRPSQAIQTPAHAEIAGAPDVVRSGQRFSELPLSRESKQALRDTFGYEIMTDVQEQCIAPLLEGYDLLGRAKTGSGKTLAFLLPVVERLRGTARRIGGEIGAVIISPTRELAMQIAKDAQRLLSSHRNLGVQCIYGGISIKKDQNKLMSQRIDILVATPGRIKDHIDNSPGFAKRLQGVKALVLDEADQLLDMGFRAAILKILESLPDPELRQSMLFSATFPKQVNQVAGFALKPTYKHISAIKTEDQAAPVQIRQQSAVVSTECMAMAIWGTIHQAMQRSPSSFKIIVFFATARLTQYWASVFQREGLDIMEIHSKKSQSYRTKVSERFRNADRAILFTSDVSARGVDYPDVTEVIQVGVPSSKEQYVHRIGRTGRAGKAGHSSLLLHDFETYFLKKLADFEVEDKVVGDLLELSPSGGAGLCEAVDRPLAHHAYKTWLGYYQKQRKSIGLSLPELVEQATRFARSINAVGTDGLPPPITKQTRSKMGLESIRSGLNVVDRLPWEG